jgi:GMP synthase (glutamine-hydrolysing)
MLLQHIGCEPGGEYETVVAEHGIELTRVEPYRGDPLPDWRQHDAIVAMGGPMSANDDATLPWLTAEKRLIADAVRAGTPFWGACLGAQLLAAALGAQVTPGPAPEVGMLPVHLTDAARRDPVFAPLPATLPTFQWHGDTFALPEDATLLASSPAYPAQAFRWGETAYGVQFHVEVSPELVAEWADVPAYARALERVLGPGGTTAVVDGVRAHHHQLRDAARTLFAGWLRAAGADQPPRCPPDAK